MKNTQKANAARMFKRAIAGCIGLGTLAFTGAAAGAPNTQQPAPSLAAARANDRLNEQERQMLKLAQEFAEQCELAMERWIAEEETTEAKLFSFLYYPIPGTDPPKFSTDWDSLADRDIRSISDKILGESASLVFAVLVDRHGYLPAHNTRYSQPLTGNTAVDLVNNRTKRIFADKTGLAAARNNQPYLIQRYLRDTGEKMADLSVPIYIKGKKWGAVRLGYRAASGL